MPDRRAAALTGLAAGLDVDRDVSFEAALYSDGSREGTPNTSDGATDPGRLALG